MMNKDVCSGYYDRYGLPQKTGHPDFIILNVYQEGPMLYPTLIRETDHPKY